MKRVALVVGIGVCLVVTLFSCGGRKRSSSPSGLLERVLASQGVSSASTFGGLVLVDAYYNVLPSRPAIGAGNSPGLMSITPSRNIVAAFDASTNTVYAVDTQKEADIGNGIRLGGPTWSMVTPTSNAIAYAAVPSATFGGFSFLGAVQVMDFSAGGISTSIAVPNAQTVISDANGTRLLVFSNGSNSVTVLSPASAVPPVDTSCLQGTPNNLCAIVPGFDRPVYGIVNGNTAYVLNCGPQCGGVQASVMFLDLPSLTITNTIPVDAATWALLKDSTLYVAGTPTTNNACTGQKTAATTCGRLDIIDLGSRTVTGRAVITDGYHWRMDLNPTTGQLFIGAHDCTNIGNANNPTGEVRGCLSIFRTADNSVFIPPDNGDVGGLQGFNTRPWEYVAQGGFLRVYLVPQDVLYINPDLLPTGTLSIVGYVGDVKAIDFF